MITKELAGENWKNWQWQQQHAVRTLDEVKEYFHNLPATTIDILFSESKDRLKFQMTPYMLSHIDPTSSEGSLRRNPWFLQFFPQGNIYREGHDAYDGTDNWERGHEFPTSNLQHKYTNRALIRFRNCFAYCNFCFESLGTLEKNPSEGKLFNWSDWEKSLEYIQSNPQIEEVILSGGEPLLNSDSRLEMILHDISQLSNIRFKRIHTRVLTHNPFRITNDLAEKIARYRVNEIALHVAHYDEVTSEFLEAVNTIRDTGGRNAPLFASHTPLLKGINNNAETLWRTFAKLYENNIKPYYLLHTMPHTPYANQQRVPVQEGVKLMKSLKRHKSNIALPEYVIVHYDGKQTVPLEVDGTPEFQYTTDCNRDPIVRFLNWKENWVEYPDAR